MKYFETATDYAFLAIEFTLDALMLMLNRFMKRFFSILKGIFDLALKFFKKQGNILRHITFPWSIIIIWVYKIIYFMRRENIPLLIPGVHMIRASVGGGKSLTSITLAEYVLEKYGMPSYFTSPVEKPRLSEDEKYKYVYHKVIDLNKYYKDGKKVLNFNFKMFPYIHKDERHLRYNPRLNKTGEYNKQFVPEHEDEILMRHQGAIGIYKYSQHMKLDGQELETLKFMHEVETIKNIPYKKWMKDGLFDFIPVKLKFETFIIKTEFDGRHTRELYREWSMNVPLDVLERFDTHAEANKYAHLPFDFE